MNKTLAKSVAGLAVAFVAIGMTFTPVMAAELSISDIMTLFSSFGIELSASDLAGLGLGATTSAMQMQSSGFDYTSMQKHGSSGQSVMNLQSALNFCGYGNLVVDGEFGAGTASAVRAMQSSKGLVADGVVGPATGAALAMCSVSVPTVTGTTETTTETTVTTSTGSDGFNAGGGDEATTKEFDIDDADDSSIDEGTNDAVLAEFDFEVEDSSILVERFDIILDAAAVSTVEQDPWDVFEKIWIEYDGDVIVSNSDADDSDEWDELDSANKINRIRMTGADLVLPMDEKSGKFTIMADISSSVDGVTSAATSDWVIYVAEGTTDTDGVRYLDEAGITGYIGSTADTASFSITQEGQEDDLKVSTSNDDPDATTLEVKQSSKSDEYSVFVFEVESDDEGTDLEIGHTYVDLAVTLPLGSVLTATPSTVIGEARLEIDGTSEDYTGTPTNWATTLVAGTPMIVTFDFDFDKDVVVDSGDTVNAELFIKFNSQQSTAVYDDGTSILGSVDPSSTNDWEVEGADDLDTAQLTGSATGETHTLYKNGILVGLDSVDADSNTVDLSDNDYAQLTIEFNVEAFGSDFYVPNVVTNTAFTANTTTVAPTTAQGVGYHIQMTGGTATTPSATLTSTADEKVFSFLVEEGNSETFTLKVTVPNAATSLLDAQSVRSILTGIGFATTDSVTSTSVFTSSLTEDYKTGYAYIAD
ncbi:MAG: peptidoglycan hydrolase-like protein with peptidoglycan-binding domain [Planctomycetota bacterium]|jgi:peptidoglycan hydrolase-like protein with peptidoglycan-binding domain